MAVTEKLTAIADAIRLKTGTSDLMTLTEMAAAISNITGGSTPSGDSVLPSNIVQLTTGMFRPTTSTGDVSFEHGLNGNPDCVVIFGNSIEDVPYDQSCVSFVVINKKHKITKTLSSGSTTKYPMSFVYMMERSGAETSQRNYAVSSNMDNKKVYPYGSSTVRYSSCVEYHWMAWRLA